MMNGMTEAGKARMIARHEETISDYEAYVRSLRSQLANPSAFHTEKGISLRIRNAEKEIEKLRNSINRLQAHPQA